MNTSRALCVAASIGVLAGILLLRRERPARSTGTLESRPSLAPLRVEDPLRSPAAHAAQSPKSTPTDFAERLAAAAAISSSPSARTHQLLPLLREWAATDPTAAARWALEQEMVPLDVALAAIFDAVAENPAAAVALARALSQQYPELAPDLGAHLVAALGRVGAHAAAAEFAREGEGSTGGDWTTAAFFAWGRAEPARALPALGAIADADRRHAAFQALVSGWAKQDPQRLLEAFPGFPPGWDQRFAVITGLRAWIQRDPEAAAAWVARTPLPFDPDWDMVLAE